MDQMNGDLQHKTVADYSGEQGQDNFEEFIYLLSHDVRGSARALTELPQWIEEDLIEEGHAIEGGLAENLTLMSTHASRLDRMLSDLLVFSRVGRMQEVEQHHFADVMTTVLTQIDIPDNFEVHTNFECPKIMIGERDIVTLLSALVSNSIKHNTTQAGQVSVLTFPHKNGCLIQVQDNGLGVEKKHRDRIFQTMVTLKSRDEVEGSGMGLAIVRKIAQFYGGSVQAISDAGSTGLVVEVVLPNTGCLEG